MAENLDVHLRLRHIRRTTQQARTQLPTNLRALGGVGPVLQPPAAGSRSVIIDGHTTRKVHTTGDQLQYLTHNKGWDGQDAHLFTREGQTVDRRTFIAQAQQDSWQFRFSVNPEKPPDFLPMQPLIESLMARVQADLGRPIDWVAAVHHDTGRPHAHVVLRGRDRQGQPLVILNDYLKNGIKYRAMRLATLLLGPTQKQTLAVVQTPTAHQQETVMSQKLTPIEQRVLAHLQDNGFASGRLMAGMATPLQRPDAVLDQSQTHQAQTHTARMKLG